MRDDFNQRDKKVLAKRVRFHCSNPECRLPTIGPNTIENKTTNIGVAAHITAASQGGPRYNLAFTSEERCSISNAIWLCQSCAKLVDSDKIKYSAELLTKWKKTAEYKAEQELTKQIEPQTSPD